jgi:CheY-like chemotaxis protein
MPLMDGITASKLITKCGYPCNIVAVTSYTSNDVKENCKKAGMKGVFNKPVTSKVMKQILE